MATESEHFPRRGSIRSAAWLAAAGGAGLSRPVFAQTLGGFDWTLVMGRRIDAGAAFAPVLVKSKAA